jgi:hypothetical protein
MSLSSSGNQGYLDVTNAILRVGTLDVYGITGVDMVTNVVKQNAVLVWDDQGADMSTPPFQLGAGVTRSTSPPEIDLRNTDGNNFMYHGLKLPNQWMAQFDLYLDTGTTGNVHLQMYTSSTTTYDDDGYQFIFDAANSTLTLEYDGAQVQQESVTYATGWQTFVVTFNRGAWGVARESTVVFTLDDDERSAVYDNTSGQYLRFETDATTSRKVRYLKFANSGPWLQSNTGDISFLTGNVSVGHHSTAHKLSVAGSANVGALTATSVNVAGGVDATSTSTGDLTLTGLGVESNIHTSNLYASEYVGVGTASAEAPLNVIGSSDLSGTPNNAIASFRATTAIPGTNDAGVVIGSVNGNLPYIADVSSASLGLSFYTQNNKRMIIKSDGNVAIGTHDPQYKLDVAGTANVGAVTLNSNVYAPNLPLAEIASNLVTWDSTTGDLMDSGGLISNKLAIVSEQPPVALTGDSTVVDGHGRYKVTTSTTTATPAYSVFSKTDSGLTTYVGLVNSYDANGDLASGNNNSLGSVNGEWIKLELPYKTTLRHFSLRQDTDTAYETQLQQFPKDFKIIGSNDDVSWTTLFSVTGVAYPTNASDPAKIFVVNASSTYKFYAIVIEKINSGAANGRPSIGEWRLFTETFTVDAGVVSTTAASGLDVGYTEHPVEPMTNPIHYAEGHGTYEADASTKSIWFNPTYGSPFDYVIGNNMWESSVNWSSSNVYNNTNWTTDVGGTRHYGEWLQLKIPYAITLAYTDVYPRTNHAERSPGAGIILGSNDGENWYKLTEFSGKTYTTNGVATKIDVNATTPYTWYRIVTSKLTNATASDLKVDIGEWRLFAEKPVTRMENVHISGELSSETLQTGYIKWPKVPLKANESEGYVASASSQYSSSFSGWNAFEDKGEYIGSGPAWASGNGSFSSGSAQTSRTTGSDTFNHEWLQIQLPQAIQLSYFNIDVRPNRLIEHPKSGFMYGSNDGVSWTKLVAYSDLTYVDYQPTRVNVQCTTPYTYYRLAVSTITGSQVYVAINELQLFESTLGVGTSATTAKLTVDGGLGLAKGSQVFAGSDVITEFPKHDRPLTKYPEVAMTANSSGGYTASASTENNGITTGLAYLAFDGVAGGDRGYHGEGDLYSSGIYQGSAGLTGPGSTNYTGEWIKLELPNKIRVTGVSFAPREGTYFHRIPHKGYILGSHTGSDGSWELIHSFDNITTSELVTKRIDFIGTNAYYNHIAMVAEEVGLDATRGTLLNFAEMEYFGHEEGDTSVDVVHRSIPNTPSPQHLAVYWDANDSNSYSFADSSNVYDLSGSGVTGTITGNNGFDAEYNAWVFDGSGDYIQKTSINSQSGNWIHSISTWIYFNDLVTGKVFSIDPPSYLYGGHNETSAFFARSTGFIWDFGMQNNNTTTLVPQKNRWYHVTLVADGTGYKKIYIDNNLQSSFSYSNNTNINMQTGATLNIGEGNLNGKIANFRLYSKVLNAEQIRELYEYDAPRFGHRQNLVSLHKGNLGVGVSHPTSRFEVAGADGLQEYPPKAMTGYETYMEGHGVFRASASTAYITASRFPYYAFDKSSEQWLSVYFAYNSDGDYTGNNSLGGISGEWIKLSMPYNTKIKHFMYESTNIPQRNITLGTFLGSNDESTWFPLAQMINPTGGNLVVEVNATDAYAHYALVAEKDVGGNEGYAGATELRLFGTPAPSGPRGRTPDPRQGPHAPARLRTRRRGGDPTGGVPRGPLRYHCGFGGLGDDGRGHLGEWVEWDVV